MTLTKYQQNLRSDDDKVFSYNTHVATVNGDKLEVFKKYAHYSATTTKHINYVAQEFNLKIIEV